MTASCSDRRRSFGRRVWKWSRAARSCGQAGCASGSGSLGSHPGHVGEKCGPERREGHRRGQIGWRDGRPPPAWSRRGDHGSQGGALQRAARTGRRGPPRQGQPAPAGGLGRAGRRGGARRRGRGGGRAARRSAGRGGRLRTRPPGRVGARLGRGRPAGRFPRSSSGRTSAPRRCSTGSAIGRRR